VQRFFLIFISPSIFSEGVVCKTRKTFRSRSLSFFPRYRSAQSCALLCHCLQRWKFASQHHEVQLPHHRVRGLSSELSRSQALSSSSSLSLSSPSPSLTALLSALPLPLLRSSP